MNPSTEKSTNNTTLFPLNIRSGHDNFSDVILRDKSLSSRSDFNWNKYQSYYGMAGIILDKGEPICTFAKAYQYDTENLAHLMRGDLDFNVIKPAEKDNQVPIVLIWTCHLGGGSWNSDPDLIAFFKSLGGGAHLDDINQKYTQFGSGDLLSVGYILANQYGNDEGYEVSHVSPFPSAMLTLQVTSFQLTYEETIKGKDGKKDKVLNVVKYLIGLQDGQYVGPDGQG